MSRAMKAVIVLAVLGALAGFASAGASAAAPAWHMLLVPISTNFKEDSAGETSEGPLYRLVVSNVGGGPTSGSISIEMSFPVGVVPLETELDGPGIGLGSACADPAGQELTCTTTIPVYPGRWIGITVPVEVTGTEGPLGAAKAVVSGGGAPVTSTSYENEISLIPPPFDFLVGKTGFSTLFGRDDGGAVTLAGSHPEQLTVSFAFPSAQPRESGPSTAAGHLRDAITHLPRGVIGNPRATSVRCTEAELLSGEAEDPGCPDASQVGTIEALTELNGPGVNTSALYNMVPPAGAPGQLAFNALNVGIFQHLTASVRSDGDYGVSAAANDVIARANNPILSVQAHLWGNPSAASHDEIRGACRRVEELDFCPIPAAEQTGLPFLTMPSECSSSLMTAAEVDSWEEPGVFHRREAPNTDTQGNQVGVNGCSALEFKPSLALQPAQSAAATPTGVQIELKIPQREELLGKDGKPQQATSTLKDITITLPEGLALNPAAGDGLQACSPAQIGMKTGVGQAPIHFTADRPQCPAASKIGSVEVQTPLLDHSLPGALYVTQPYQNPFGTLLGVYVVIDSPEDGIVAKLAGRTEADPKTGQLRTTFTENPELPVSSFKVDLFGGSRAALRTPRTCGTFTTTSVQTPWSGTAPVNTTDSFKVARGANGRPCVKSEAEMPNTPGFEAGTITPLAADFSPFAGRLHREDGTQQLTGLNLTMPAGLTGKLAGVQTCSEAAIAAAATKTGVQELASPSCPAGSEIGEVKTGAGAGPTPYFTTGKIYLAGPYKGGPFSAAVIVPAVAGPFDLGTVVVRASSQVDPVTAQVSFQSESFPTILEGIPLELRDARLSLARPSFILNPTNCSEKTISGEAISLLGSIASLSQRFQVGGCRGLDYEPKLSIRLFGRTGRGAHPRLRAILTAKLGEANTARASVALPRSEFLENAHIQTVCTRVQFAAEQCPAGSIYGHAKAITPLLDEPLEGPVYLRSSSNKLPDMVAALKGPPSRPIEVELKGRIDSVNGGIRSTFDVVPDQPVSKFILNMKGGRKGLIVNSRNLCERTYRATAKFDGQNGKVHDFNPVMKNSCKGQGKARKRRNR